MFEDSNIWANEIKIEMGKYYRLCLGSKMLLIKNAAKELMNKEYLYISPQYIKFVPREHSLESMGLIFTAEPIKEHLNKAKGMLEKDLTNGFGKVYLH
ncbi:MAG: hypothetical protein APR54_09345 [Candidatus Cloacimonas sp. SDB]|nr:MAG: hypothetical protein APR54_09345 [Candidatus Cloacimonas sp. SDB]